MEAKNQETFCWFMDFQKASDFVDEYLLYNLVENGICGRIYNVINPYRHHKWAV